MERFSIKKGILKRREAGTRDSVATYIGAGDSGTGETGDWVDTGEVDCKILKQLELELETQRQQTLEQRILEQVQLRMETAQQPTEMMLGKMSQALEQEERLLSKTTDPEIEQETTAGEENGTDNYRGKAGRE